MGAQVNAPWVVPQVVFSSDRRYRYLWKQVWEPGKNPLHFILLNPSTADERRSDPTVTRCIRRARILGSKVGGIAITNLFAYRATKPKDLIRCQAEGLPIVSQIPGVNDTHILREAKKAYKTVVGWGNHGHICGRGDEMMRLLDQEGIKIYHLGLTGQMQPRHPLYTSYTQGFDEMIRERKHVGL